eukprot:357902-Chlamydomonas_euryale.AAC.17
MLLRRHDAAPCGGGQADEAGDLAAVERRLSIGGAKRCLPAAAVHAPLCHGCGCGLLNAACGWSQERGGLLRGRKLEKEKEEREKTLPSPWSAAGALGAAPCSRWRPCGCGQAAARARGGCRPGG